MCWGSLVQPIAFSSRRRSSLSRWSARGRGQFAAGSTAFGGGSVSLVNFSNLDATQTSVSGFVGADFDVSQNRRVFVCPNAWVSYSVGPDIGSVDVSAFGVGGGGSVGVVVSDTDQLMVVPTFGVSAVWERLTAELRGFDEGASGTYGVANVRVGLIFNRRIGIRPGISVSVPDPDVAFSLAFAFNFGG